MLKDYNVDELNSLSIGDLYALIYYYPSIGGAGWDRREVCMEVLKKKLIECDKRIFGTSIEEMYKNCKKTIKE